MAIGAGVEITNLPGYLPSFYHPRLDQLFGDNMAALLGKEAIGEAGHQTGSTDIGDVSHLMPALQPYIKVGKGNLHTEDFVIGDPHLAYVESAKGLALTVVDLLWDEAREGRQIKTDYRPKYTKEQYLRFMAELSGKSLMAS
jgi:metal-dependent amidase/aminoacylase/carboxypeptidase family protein